MIFAVEQRGADAEGHGVRRDFFALDGGEAFFLQAIEFFLGKGRMKDQVGVDVESLVHIYFQGVEIDGGRVEIGAGGKFGAEGGELFADLEGIASGRAFLEHALFEAAGAAGVDGIGGKAAIHHERKIDDGSGVALGQNNFQSVGERSGLHRGKLQRHGRAKRGRFGAIERRGSIKSGRIGVDFQNVVAVAEPLVGGFLDAGRRGGLDFF